MTAKRLAGKQKTLRPRSRRRPPGWAINLANEAPARAAAYLEVLLGDATRKNGWQPAGAAGMAAPYRFRFRHLLGRTVWGTDARRDEHLTHVFRALGQREAVLASDEQPAP